MASRCCQSIVLTLLVLHGCQRSAPDLGRQVQSQPVTQPSQPTDSTVEADPIKVIERTGAAVSVPRPHVTVFIPRTPTGEIEKAFGDDELRSIVPALKELRHFAALSLDGSSVTDLGLTELRTVGSLRRLNVAGTAVTVDGLASLQGLQIEQIIVGSDDYSDEDLATLQRLFPDAAINLFGNHPMRRYSPK